MVTITDKAKIKIQELLSKNQGKYLRLYLQGMGWGGPRIGLALDEPKDDEQPVQVNGIDLLVADTVEPWVVGSTVDYIENWYKKGFTVTADRKSC